MALTTTAVRNLQKPSQPSWALVPWRCRPTCGTGSRSGPWWPVTETFGAPTTVVQMLLRRTSVQWRRSNASAAMKWEELDPISPPPSRGHT